MPNRHAGRASHSYFHKSIRMNTSINRVSRRHTNRFLQLVALGVSVSVLLSACGGSSSEPPPPPAEPTKVSADVVAAGKAAIIKNGCIACHSIDGMPEAVGKLAPNLSKIYVDAQTIITQADYKSSQGKAKTGEEYIRESILNTGAYLYPTCPTGPCPANLMPQTFKDTIPKEEFESIVGYLMTLGR